MSGIGTGLTTSGTPPITGLTGSDLASQKNSAPNEFFFTKLGSGPYFNGLYDTLYVADSSATTTLSTPGISKYTWDGSNWNLTGSIGTTGAWEGLIGSASGGQVTLYVTQPSGISSITDNSGYGGTFSAAIVPIATPASNESFDGLAFVPQLPAIHFAVTAAPTTDMAGAPFSVTVTAEDSSNNPVPGYTGTVRFSSTDMNGAVSLPSNYTFKASDHGTHTFTNLVTLVTAGSQSVSATDTVTGGLGSATVMITPASVQQFGVSAPVDSTAGQAFSFTVTAEDQFGNTVPSYTGTVQFSKSDGGAGSSVPGSYPFVAGDNGVHTFTLGATLVTAGNQTITASDPSHSASGSATVDNFVVSPFTPGDLVVYRVGIGGGANITGAAAPVFLDEYDSGGNLVETVPLPVASISGGNQALVAAGNATSEGQLTLSPDGQYLALTGYDAPLNTNIVSNTSSIADPRTVAIVNAAGAINSTTALTDFSSENNIRSAITTDGNSLWVTGGTGGLGYTTVGSTTSTDIDPTDEQSFAIWRSSTVNSMCHRKSQSAWPPSATVRRPLPARR